MSNSSDFPHYALEIDELKARLLRLETKLKEEQDKNLSDPIRTFLVTLKVTTKASTWGYERVDACELEDHFNEFICEISSASYLDDPGDSIIVQGVKEVTTTNGNDT